MMEHMTAHAVDKTPSMKFNQIFKCMCANVTLLANRTCICAQNSDDMLATYLLFCLFLKVSPNKLNFLQTMYVYNIILSLFQY